MIEFDRSSMLNHYAHNNNNNNEHLSFAICDDLIRTNKSILIGKYCTIIHPIVLLLFGTMNESLTFNQYEISLTDKTLLQLRTKVCAYVKRKLQSLGCDNTVSNDDQSVNLLVNLFSSLM
jgi:hypothetical protein